LKSNGAAALTRCRIVFSDGTHIVFLRGPNPFG
jgi:hypothetical protein